jgi:hypothetical protein
VGGLSIFGAGVLLIGAARVVLVVALYLFFEDAGRSPRLAGIATLLYAANPNFVFFDAQFSYESLALPCAALTLFAALRLARVPAGVPAGLAIAFVLGLVATVMSHHLSGYALAAFLALWWLATLRRDDRRARREQRRRERRVAGAAALVAAGANLAWLLYAGTPTIQYLVPVFGGGVGDLLRWITGEGAPRRLFSDFAGQRSATWEQLAGYAAVALILLGLPFGLLRIWRGHRSDAVALALGVGALAYPATLVLRLTERGAETSNRASEFLFVSIGFVLAVAITELWLPDQPRLEPASGRWRPTLRLPATVIASGASLIFVGGVIVGWGPLARLPGPYLVGADPRSIEPQSVAAAHAALDLLGPGNRFAADRTNRLLLGSYGRQRPVSAFVDGVGIAPLFFSPEMGPAAREVIPWGRIRYVLVDRRLSTGLPAVGVYVEHGEANTFRHTTPVPAAALAKFDTLEGVSRLFDSGDIAIYDVGALAGAR